MPLITQTILIDNLPAGSRVIDVLEELEVEAHVDMASILRMKLRISLSANGAQWTLLDDGLFERLARIMVLVTIGAGLPSVVFDGYVTETEATLNDPETGSSWLTVIAMDATAIMNLEERVREWPNMTDGLIALQIFAEHGLVPIADPTLPPRVEVDTTVIQRDTDMRFLRSLAKRSGFDVYVQPTVVPGVVEGHFHAPRLFLPPQGVLSVSMTGVTNVGSFVMKNEMLRPATVQTAGLDAGTLEAQRGESSGTGQTELGRRSLHAGSQPRVSLPAPNGLSRSGELQTAAQANADRSTWAITVTCLVDSYLYGSIVRSGETILVRGAGASLNGTYFVERVLHSFTGEDHGYYMQQLTLRRNAIEPTGAEPYALAAGLSI